ncbi:hypothetical protein [Candidatus Ichthyocystis sparus]|uniref:hypothetical protein n=1 Tax=Candidatus Ichthyocystis sparus TaxID=1561004 RepID=UPI000B81C257|nr:hypothetical protein [Candidatus Ichthyocystis sparus]
MPNLVTPGWSSPYGEDNVRLLDDDVGCNSGDVDGNDSAVRELEASTASSDVVCIAQMSRRSSMTASCRKILISIIVTTVLLMLVAALMTLMYYFSSNITVLILCVIGLSLLLSMLLALREFYSPILL